MQTLEGTRVGPRPSSEPAYKPITQSDVFDLLAKARIAIGGGNPWDITVHNPAALKRIVDEGMLGLGDSYVEGMWDCAALDQFFARIIPAGLLQLLDRTPPAQAKRQQDELTNPQDPERAVQNVAAHYDEMNELILKCVGPLRAYTCAVFKDPLNPVEGLEAAERHKLRLLCRKLDLRKGDRLLDIGCGWGSLLAVADEDFGVWGHGITASQKQAKFVRDTYQLPVQCADYRSLEGTFDKIVSVGMFEHVGKKNMRTYMEVVNEHLAPGGIFVLHFFHRPHKKNFPDFDTWTDKHIFPGMYLTTPAETLAASEDLFELAHLEEIGRNYTPTLMGWYKNLENHAKKNGMDEKLFRTWKYYFLSCAGAFQCRAVQLSQLVFTKCGDGLSYTWNGERARIQVG